jgi:hypothetical protein
MTATRKIPEDDPGPGSKTPSLRSHARSIGIGLGAMAVITAFAYMLWKGHWATGRLFSMHPTTARTDAGSSTSPTKPSKPDTRLTREGIDRLLAALDHAIRRKDVDGVLRLIALDATITIHMKQGTQQQLASLTREEYRKTLAMGFAFPSANDYTRVNTSVSIAPDERSAKVAFRSTETLRQDRREFKIEGEETLVLSLREGEPLITSLEQVVPSDST